MKSMKLASLLIAFSAAAAASPAIARDAADPGFQTTAVAFEAMRTGRTHDAIAELSARGDVDARDPSRLINLGSAFARLGRTEQAAAMFRAAIDSPIRYDVELADGKVMDSRWAARAALDLLAPKLRTVAVALADHE